MPDNASLINAITGEKINTDVKFFMSLDEFKDFISLKWHIPCEQVLILLPFGNKLRNFEFRECLKGSSTLKKNEFYIYDRRLFSIINEPVSQELRTFETDSALYGKAETLLESLVKDTFHERESALLKPLNSPLSDANMDLKHLNSRTVASLLTTNLGWLSALEIDVHYFRTLMGESAAQTSQILTCLSICEQYLRLYCFDVEKLYNSNVEFLNQLAQNGQASKWRECYYKVLQKLEGMTGTLEKYVDYRMLEEKEKFIKQLDQSTNQQLKKLKKDLDSNAYLRTQITNSITFLQNESSLINTKDDLEATMLERFDELVQETRCRSREILDQDILDSSDSDMENIHSFLLEARNETSGKLYTIAQALYTRSEQVIRLRHELQVKAIILLGQIAFIQVETVGIKKKLLNDCSKDLDVYQKNEILFAQVEDIPLIYGLFLVEKYRRECWVLQVLTQTQSLSDNFKKLKKKEEAYRAKWRENFGATASLFCQNLENFSDLESVDALFLNGLLDHEQKDSNEASILQQSLARTREVVHEYLNQLLHLGIGGDVPELITQSYSEINKFQITITQERNLQESSTFASSQISGYRARIKKLESLLHDARYSNPGQWPSGILNQTFVTPFHNSVTTVSSKVNSLSLMDTDHDASVASVLELERNIQKLQETIENLRRDNETKDAQYSAAKTRISDLELETRAFKETMIHLNKELARLTEEEERLSIHNITQQKSFKSEVQDLVRENSKLIQNYSQLRLQVEEEDTSKKEVIARANRLQQELGQEKKLSKERTADLEAQIDNLNNRLKYLEQENSDLKTKQQERSQEDSAGEFNQENSPHSTIISQKPEVVEGFDKLHNQIKDSESTLYEVFASDVFILENIGLLLSLDDSNNIVIKRVKGLRRGHSQSVLDDSIQISKTEEHVKSTVYKDIKGKYEEVHNAEDIESHKSLVKEMQKLYDNKLYETAVIRRFKDIETLAKKLTKENKKKRVLLDSYQNQRLTLKNFQIGDLALFLPTREHNSPTDSSVSSLNSSFSSVDLSTPPPFETAAVHPPSAGKEKMSKTSKSRPWAAFTAFDDNTRYFLRDENGITKGKDWFVGRILTMESFIADDASSNPYRLSKGSAWFQVTATLISCQS